MNRVPLGHRAAITAVSVGICVAPCGSRWATAQTSPTLPSEDQLLDEVRALRSEVKELRARLESQGPATRPAATGRQPSVPSSEVVRPPIDNTALLRDADRRSELLDVQGLTAGYSRDTGFFIRNEDGSSFLHPWAFIQARYAGNYRENAKNGRESDFESGFELPRMKFILDGNVLSTDITYQFIWATSDTTGNLGLQDAWARYHFPNTPFAVRGGQIRDPVDHEQILYATRSLTPERSIVNNVLLNGDDIVKGASVSYGYDTNATVRTEVAFSSGERNFDTTFQTFPTNPATWGAAGRVEWKLFGKWVDYNQFTALGDKQDLLVLGAGADYTEAGDTGGFTHVADVQFDSTSGFMVYGAYLGRYTSHNGGPPGTNGGFTGPATHAPDTYDSTFRLMAGWLIDGHFEPFARYEYIHFDGRALPASARNSVVHDITIGFNYYWYGQRAKFSAAASYLPNGSPVANPLGDLLVNPRGNQVIFQAGFQLIL